MKFKNKQEAIDLLQHLNIHTSSDGEILYPLGAEYEDEAHVCIDYLIDDHGFGIKYI